MADTETDVQVAAEPASLIIISDFVCPWCYVGLVEIERLSQEYDLAVHYVPFLLRPETPPEGIPSRRIVEAGAPPSDLEKRGERLGIKFNRGRTWSSNSHLALEASHFAHEYGDQRRFHHAMFKAYFENLEDIGQIDTVVRVGAAAGLDEANLREALTDGVFRQVVDQGINWSRRIGVTAIPSFIFADKYVLVGAHELDTFRKAMAEVGQPPKQP